jgi:CRISPR system Cascade subunit CasB
MLPYDETIATVSQRLLELDPGPLAELRRMEPNSAGTPIFWRLAAELGFREDQTTQWMQILRILAILTPKGRRLSPAVRLHDRSRQLGRVLCDGGNPAWPSDPKDPRPALSEARFARLLVMPAAHRGEALERIARMLARSRTPERGINCTEIARLLLQPNDQLPIQKIARDYYAQLDHADRNSTKEGTTK